MQMQFLGTSAGVPTRNRHVSALALQPEKGRRWYLIDCGEGTQYQLMQTPLSAARLEAVLITHIHGDHCYGLPGLLASASMGGRRTPLTVIGPKAVRAYLDAVRVTTGLHLGFELVHVDAATLTTPLVLADVSVCATPLSHGVECYAYAFEERGIEARLDVERLRSAGVPSGPLWGQLYRGENVLDDQGRWWRGDDFRLPGRVPRRIVVAGDNNTPSCLRPLCQDVDVLVHEATYTEAAIDHLGTDNGHSSAARIAAFAADVALPHLVLTHFSPRYVNHPHAPVSIADIEREARAHYGGYLALAEDLARYQLSREKCLVRTD